MAITKLTDILINQAKGYSYSFPFIGSGNGAGAAAVAASGFLSVSILTNNVGTTYPSTLQTVPIPAGVSSELLTSLLISAYSTSGAKTSVLGRLYTLGTLDLANAAGTPYDGFTHDAGTFPVQRKIMGTVQNVPLIPILYMTAAAATTAPSFILKTTVGGAGYTNQSGSAVVGTKTFTLPSATTAVQSGYILRLEDGDSSIFDLTQISVTTKGTAGTATLFGFEPIQALNCLSGLQTLLDSFVAGMTPFNIQPAAPATGSVTSNLCVVSYGTAATVPVLWLNTVMNS